MPVLPSTSLLNTLVGRNAVTPAANATDNALQVVCAWPLSGQYGTGSRYLYYVLVVACVLARKQEWLRNACLAAALLFPAVAAIHGIVLAAVHVDGAVDMDIYGAFQLCTIGILAAPVTVRRSRTYFYDPGRNAIFLWTGIILAGLLSLTVEFYRISTSDCRHDDSGRPITPQAAAFPYGNKPSCGLICSLEQGPYSPLRGGSVDNIYVIPAPEGLTFGTGTLLAAACCIPAILLLISMWDKILEINWKNRVGGGHSDERNDELIEGTNGATIGNMKRVNNVIRHLLSVVEIPVFYGAVLAILIIGERNFFSSQVMYQTEPISSIGQWGPLVGTLLAALGSLYLVVAAEMAAVKDEVKSQASMHHCNCSHHHHGGEPHPTLPVQPGADARSMHGGVFQGSPQDPTGLPAMQEVGIGPFTGSPRAIDTPDATDVQSSISNDLRATANGTAPGTVHEPKRSSTTDAPMGKRRKVTRTLTAIGNYLGTPAHDWYDDSEFKRGPALDFPEIPGEEHRNKELNQIREQWNVTPMLREQRSRAGSFHSRLGSGLDVEGSPSTPRASSPFRSPAGPERLRGSTLPAEPSSFERPNPTSSPSAGSKGAMLQTRRATLEVPSPAHFNPTRNRSSASSISSVVITRRGRSPPRIVTSSDVYTSSPVQTPVSNPPTPSSFSDPLPPPSTTASSRPS